VHEVADDKVEKVHKKEISLQAVVEVKFCKMNNFVNDCVKYKCYAQNISYKNPKVICKIPTVIYTQQNVSQLYKIWIISIQETLCKVNLGLKWFKMEWNNCWKFWILDIFWKII